ncbi:OmpP1/FadL family transporter [Thermoflexibacter ruber]|uniref:Outer membrane protein transport protein (OMPP1/FadL/TodX) n=1 Tax=Thermoflexibacter ruber TaxID=1003 RepID=A0A1I2CPX1_9BACT|nr:hypothetical protein [Thermoflexibacter ruber]SFE70397.1 hypothetical protein SAMN04488541_1005107 [Thermoflexibacter ruber]
MKLKYWTFLIVFFFNSLAFAQNPDNALGYYFDALRYTNTQFGGSARFQGIAGANTALGGDPTAALTNPAGLGFIRRAEMIVSTSINLTNANTSFINNSTPDSRTNLSINQLGVVWGTDRGSDADLRGTAFAITFTRNNDLNRQWSYSGLNDRNNIISSFLAGSGGSVTWNEFDDEVRNGIFTLSGMAYATRLILPDLNDPTNAQNQYVTFVPIRPTEQREKITETGAQNQWNLSYAINYKDMLYIGAGIGIPTIRYNRTKEYTEIPQANSPLNGLRLRERLSQSGIGINASLGVIFRPVDYIRLGASIITPTIYSVNDNYDADLSVSYNNYTIIEIVNGVEVPVTLRDLNARTILLQSQYNMRTPLRINGGVAIFLGKQGFISGDVELVDYSGVRFSNPQPVFNMESDNAVIKLIYRSTVNIRLGSEFRFGTFRIRGGYAMYGSALKEDIPAPEGQMTFITGGLGKRTDKFYLDGAISYRTSQSSYRPYLLRGAEPTAITDNTRLTATFTLGFFF